MRSNPYRRINTAVNLFRISQRHILARPVEYRLNFEQIERYSAFLFPNKSQSHLSEINFFREVFAMPTDISVAFIKQYESEVHLAYQQTGTLLRNTVRKKNNIKGKSTTFQIIGKGKAVTKVRHEVIAPMNLDHSNVEVLLEDYYAGDWVDKLDELKTNIDERQAVVQSGAYALGRKTDELIIGAFNKSTNEVGDGTSALNLDLTLDAFAALNGLDVPDDGNRYGVVSPLVWNQLLKIEQFAKSNYVDDKPFMKGRECKKWLGINWLMHTGLPLDSEGKIRNCFLYHSSAIGHAIGAEVKTEMTYDGPHAAHWVNNMMSQGAGLIDNNGIIKLKVKEK